eukprot:scaffold21582_cov97-Isochrysis_galbana.AAC.1
MSRTVPPASCQPCRPPCPHPRRRRPGPPSARRRSPRWPPLAPRPLLAPSTGAPPPQAPPQPWCRTLRTRPATAAPRHTPRPRPLAAGADGTA